MTYDFNYHTANFQAASVNVMSNAGSDDYTVGGLMVLNQAQSLFTVRELLSTLPPDVARRAAEDFLASLTHGTGAPA